LIGFNFFQWVGLSDESLKCEIGPRTGAGNRAGGGDNRAGDLSARDDIIIRDVAENTVLDDDVVAPAYVNACVASALHMIVLNPVAGAVMDGNAGAARVGRSIIVIAVVAGDHGAGVVHKNAIIIVILHDTAGDRACAIGGARRIHFDPVISVVSGGAIGHNHLPAIYSRAVIIGGRAARRRAIIKKNAILTIIVGHGVGHGAALKKNASVNIFTSHTAGHRAAFYLNTTQGILGRRATGYRPVKYFNAISIIIADRAAGDNTTRSPFITALQSAIAIVIESAIADHASSEGENTHAAGRNIQVLKKKILGNE